MGQTFGPSIGRAGPDPRSRRRARTEAETRAEELAREKHKDEMRAIYEERRAKEAERKKGEAQALADRRAAQSERDRQAYYDRHPEEAAREMRRLEYNKQQAESRAAQKAEQERRSKLTPDQLAAEQEAKRTENRRKVEQYERDWYARKAAEKNTEKAMAESTDRIVGGEGARYAGYKPSKAAAPEVPAVSQKMAEPAAPAKPAPSDTFVGPPAPVAAAEPAYVQQQRYDDERRARRATEKSIADTKAAQAKSVLPRKLAKPGPATQSAGSAFEEARKANPNLTPSDFFASRPDLIASMQAEQTPFANLGSLTGSGKRPAVQFDARGNAKPQKLPAPMEPHAYYAATNPKVPGAVPDPIGETLSYVNTGIDRAGDAAAAVGGAFYDRFLAPDKRAEVMPAPARDPEVAALQQAGNLAKPLGQGGIAFDPTIRPGFKPSMALPAGPAPKKKTGPEYDLIDFLLPDAMKDPNSMYYFPGKYY